MVYATIQVHGAHARVIFRKRIPAGIIGAQVRFEFDDTWDNLKKTAVFRGCVTKDVSMDSDIVKIPAAVVAKPFRDLDIGVYGVNTDGTIAIPTLWADVGRVYCAADPSGDEDVDDALPFWADLQLRVKKLEEEGIDQEEIERIIAEYLENHFETGPDDVLFPTGLKTTYAIGKVKLENGMGTLVEPGGTLADFFNVFIDEKNPTTVQPSVSLSFPQADAYEVGEKITPSYSASLNPGSYTYGPATGVTVESWEVTDSKGNTADTASGSFPEIQVTDGMSYTVTAKAEHTAGADPVTNTGNKYEAGKIPAGSKKKTSGAVTGYRNTFYGTLTEKGTLDSGKIRGLNQSKKALADGNKFTITVPVGALRVVFAYPATLRDVTGVKDDAMGMPIETGFTKSTMDINGANGYDTASYKVYVMDFAGPLDTANTYTVTI